MKTILQAIKTIWSKGAIHIFTGSFLNKFVVFFGSIVIVRLLSKTEYGMLGYAENLYNFAYILAGIGISNAIMRYVVLADTIEAKKAVFYFSSNVRYFAGSTVALFSNTSKCRCGPSLYSFPFASATVAITSPFFTSSPAFSPSFASTYS